MTNTLSADAVAPLSENEQQELAASLDEESLPIPLRRADPHTRAMVGRVRERVAQWVPPGTFGRRDANVPRSA